LQYSGVRWCGHHQPNAKCSQQPPVHLAAQCFSAGNSVRCGRKSTQEAGKGVGCCLDALNASAASKIAHAGQHPLYFFACCSHRTGLLRANSH
jgi:hypothetical protein